MDVVGREVDYQSEDNVFACCYLPNNIHFVDQYTELKVRNDSRVHVAKIYLQKRSVVTARHMGRTIYADPKGMESILI
jgi:hypothetical protein